jgi:hypothetical protein
VNIVYTISVKQNLSNIQLLNNGEINSLSNPYSTIPADGEILNALLNLDNDLRINQLYIFSIQYDETHTMTGSDYSGAHSVIVKPYENSNIYTGSLEVFFCTSKMNIADDCTVNSISIPSYYTLSNIPTNTLLTKIIVSNPNITTSKLAGTSYSLAKGASNITLTINNSNQYYNVSQVTLTVNTTNLDTCKA